MARYYDKLSKGNIVEVFKNKMPTREGLKEYTGYVVFLNGEQVRGSDVCKIMEIDYGKDSAPRYLWRYLNKIADDKGVQEPEGTFESYTNS